MGSIASNYLVFKLRITSRPVETDYKPLLIAKIDTEPTLNFDATKTVIKTGDDDTYADVFSKLVKPI